jgi:hypothetical protein
MTDLDTIITHLQSEIRFLRDIHEIRMLPIMYCHHVRDFNIDAIMAQYVPEAEFELIGIATPGIYEGAGLRSMMGDALPEFYPWPLTHNHQVDFVGDDKAHGRVHAEFRLAKEAYRATHIGLYEDIYEKHEGVWKFKRRKLTATALP